jgi:hypothetical protein
MESRICIILAVDQHDKSITGTVVFCKNDCIYSVGDYNKGWYAPNFSDFEGTINLSND